MRLEYAGTVSESRADATKAGAAVHAIVDFLQTCDENAASRREIIAHLEACGVASRTAERALTNAKSDGLVTALGGGTWQLVVRPLRVA